MAALSENPSFKSNVAFECLVSDNKKTITEENLSKVARLIIKDETIIKKIFEKVDASGLGEASEEDFINFLPNNITTTNKLYICWFTF